jgi:DNA-binding NarL/FixJ family response regulator
VTQLTPRYVHYLLDHMLRGEPLRFHGVAVPGDVQRRILLEHRRHPAPAPAEPDPDPAPPTPVVVAAPVLPPDSVTLTARELQFIRGVAEGKSNKEIGDELFISEDTIKTHARRLYRKLGARDRANAVAIVFRAGLIK